MSASSAAAGLPIAVAKTPNKRSHRIEVDVIHALLERDDGVVCDLDVLRTHLRAALRDIAVAQAGVPFEQRSAIEHVLGMHLQARDPDEVARAEVGLLQVVVSEHVAYVLA